MDQRISIPCDRCGKTAIEFSAPEFPDSTRERLELVYPLFRLAARQALDMALPTVIPDGDLRDWLFQPDNLKIVSSLLSATCAYCIALDVELPALRQA